MCIHIHINTFKYVQIYKIQSMMSDLETNLVYDYFSYSFLKQYEYDDLEKHFKNNNKKLNICIYHDQFGTNCPFDFLICTVHFLYSMFC